MTTINHLIHLYMKWQKHSFDSHYSSVKAMKAAQAKPMQTMKYSAATPKASSSPTPAHAHSTPHLAAEVTAGTSREQYNISSQSAWVTPASQLPWCCPLPTPGQHNPPVHRKNCTSFCCSAMHTVPQPGKISVTFNPCETVLPFKEWSLLFAQPISFGIPFFSCSPILHQHH